MNRLPLTWSESELQVQDASLADVPALLQLFRSLAPFRHREPAFADIADDDMAALVRQSIADRSDFQLQIVRTARGPIAYFHTYHAFRGHADVIFISMFLVSSDAQGKHVGSNLFAGLRRRLETAYSRCWLKVSTNNVPAIHFWHKQGFVRLIDVIDDHNAKSGYLVLQCDLNVT